MGLCSAVRKSSVEVTVFTDLCQGLLSWHLHAKQLHEVMLHGIVRLFGTLVHIALQSSPEGVLLVLVHVVLNLIRPLQLLIFAPGDANLLVVESSLQRSHHIHVVVLNDAQDHITGRDTLSSLSRLEFSRLLDLCVDVI